MPNPMESLQTLLRLKSPTNIRTDDPWLAGRRADITSGIDEFLPDEESYREGQFNDTMEQVARNRNTPGMGDAPVYTSSRDSRRGADMTKLKLMLGLKRQEHEQKMAEGTLKGEYDVAGQVAGAQAAMDRAMVSQNGQNFRAGGSQDTQRDVAEIRTDASAARETQAAADRMELEKYRRTTPQATSTNSGDTGLFALLRRFLPGGGAPAQPTPAGTPGAPTEDADSMNASEFDFDPATGKLIPRR